jgi:hypothetical protein
MKLLSKVLPHIMLQAIVESAFEYFSVYAHQSHQLTGHLLKRSTRVQVVLHLLNNSLQVFNAAVVISVLSKEGPLSVDLEKDVKKKFNFCFMLTDKERVRLYLLEAHDRE